MKLTAVHVLASISPTALANQKVLLGADINPLDKSFEDFAVRTLEGWHVPGIAVAVVDGEHTWAAGYGNATLPSTPVTPSTLFYGGSTTKAFTAAAISQLIDASNGASRSPLSWRTPISELIRADFVLQERDGWAQQHLTLEDAMSHRTGFPRHDKALTTTYGPDGHKATAGDVARMLRHLPSVTEPRTDWRYCNVMWMVVSHVVQTLTGEWLGTTLREKIWEPLGMNSTYLSLEDALAAPEDLAYGYYWDYKGGEGFKEVGFSGLDEASGAGGIVSNVLDYAKWVKCLLDEAAPLSKVGHQALKTARINIEGSGKGFDAPKSYSLGWQVGTYKGHRVYDHSGGMEAYGAEVYFLPDLGYGVVTLGNTGGTSNIVGNILTWKLINDKLGVDEKDRFDWDAAGKQSLERKALEVKTAVDTLYPERADPPFPRALPLQDYTGTYFHPAYDKITIELAEPTSSRHTKQRELKAKRGEDHFVWPMTFEFEHVSAEFWVIYIDFLKVPNGLEAQLGKAEFRIGPSGKADQLAVEFMEDGSEGVIVFEKIE